MGRQLTSRLTACLVWLLAACLPLSAAAEPLLHSDKQYRLAAWYFYQADYYQALLQLSLAPDSLPEASLLQVGLLLQLDMPAATASLLQRLVDNQTASGKLPRELRNIALLQFSRFLYEKQSPEQARHYLNQLTPPLDKLAGQVELLQQLLNWPTTVTTDPQVFSRLAGQSELPYVVINQILALRQQQQPEQALQLLTQLSSRLQAEPEPGFWQQLFRWRMPEPLLSNSSERQALADYIQLLNASLLVDQLQWTRAQQVLSKFASNSVLTLPAMTLYRDVLTENRQIPALLTVLQQLIARYPYAPASWLAARQLGNQLERALAPRDALAAYRWADQYYQQQLAANSEHASMLRLEQLMDLSGLSGWQHYQLGQQASLFQLQGQLSALHQLQQLQQQRLSRLANLTEIVPVKLAQQQQLDTLTAQESLFSMALAAQQQQLLAQLNSGLQQRRLAEREQLLEMRRLNTQAMARIMERLFLTSVEEQ